MERAIKFGCKKLQFAKGCFDRSMVDKARANSIITNVFRSDEPEEAEMFLKMGIDVILSNNYNRITQAVDKFR